MIGDCGACSFGLPAMVVRGFVAVALLALAATGSAEVTLATAAHKVEGAGAKVRLVDAETVTVGDQIRYTITFTNEGGAVVDARSIVITNPIPDSTEYVDGTAGGEGVDITFSVDGETFAGPGELMVPRGESMVPATASDYRSIRWTYRPELGAGESGAVWFDALLR